jgi:D-alanyl-D-alanine carboxypeptidase
MLKQFALTLFLCCTVAALPATGFGQAAQPKRAADHTQLKQKLQQKLDEWRAAGNFPGATAGVSLNDWTSFGLATGLSDVAANQPMTPRDRLLQGSVGKTYVAAIALQLVKEGKLGLDDKIEKYLGKETWFARLPNARDITVRMLMNHTSGLVRYELNEKFLADLTKNPAKVWQPEEEVAYLFDAKAPFAAGQGWDYSDTNYIVLGMIIERVTQSRYYDLLRKRLLRPLKLNDTVPSDSRRIPGLAQGYAGEKNVFGGSDAMLINGQFAINPQFEWTGGGIASTSADLARWAKLLYEGKAFDPALLPEMFKGVPARLGPETKYGLGVIIRPTKLGVAYGHSGFFPGYLTEMLYFPAQKFALAVQVNTSVGQRLGKSPLRILLELAEIVAAN